MSTVLVTGRRRTLVRVEGTVQGVGFRPYVYRLAGQLGLSGYVLNDEHGVLIEVEGSGAKVAEFLARLGADAPPLALLERIACEEREPLERGSGSFQIRARITQKARSARRSLGRGALWRRMDTGTSTWVSWSTSHGWNVEHAGEGT